MRRLPDALIGLLLITGAAAALAQTRDPPTILRGGQAPQVVPRDADDPKSDAKNWPRPETSDSGSPTFLADPKTYKLLWEDASLRVIAVTWRGLGWDQPHSHPLPSIVYYLDDCELYIHEADGTTREVTVKHGTAATVPMTLKPHMVENPVAEDCRAVIVERK